VITFSAAIDPSALAPIGRVVVSSPIHVELLVQADRIPALVHALAALPLVDLAIEAPSLEDAFLERYQ
jgi:hypothetical protein